MWSGEVHMLEKGDSEAIICALGKVLRGEEVTQVHKTSRVWFVQEK